MRRDVDRSSSVGKSQRDLLTVDLHGLRQSLAAMARARGVSVGGLVRSAVGRELQEPRDGLAGDQGVGEGGKELGSARVSFRLPSGKAAELQFRARRAGLSLGRYVTVLMRDGTEPLSASVRRDYLAALVRSNAELSTMSRRIAALSLLLGQGSHDAAQAYRVTLETLAADVHSHLVIAAESLAVASPPRMATKEVKLV